MEAMNPFDLAAHLVGVHVFSQGQIDGLDADEAVEWHDAEHEFRHDHAHEGTAKFDTLTRREREVLELVAHALSNEAIAALLDIRLRTCEHHLESIYRKLNVSHDVWNPRVRAVIAYLEAA